MNWTRHHRPLVGDPWPSDVFVFTVRAWTKNKSFADVMLSNLGGSRHEEWLLEFFPSLGPATGTSQESITLPVHPCDWTEAIHQAEIYLKNRGYIYDRPS